MPVKRGRADHLALDYQLLLDKGIKGIIEILDDEIGKLNLGDGSCTERYEFLYCCKIELQGLGVSSDIIENNISNIDDEILYNKMRKIIDKMKNNKKYSSSELKSKIYNHLISSGYSKEKVIYILNEYNF